MDESEWVFLQTQDHQTFLWLRYTDDIFFIRTHGAKNFYPFVVTYHPILKSIGNIIRKNLYLLYTNEEAKRYVHLDL